MLWPMFGIWGEIRPHKENVETVKALLSKKGNQVALWSQPCKNLHRQKTDVKICTEAK